MAQKSPILPAALDFYQILMVFSSKIAVKYHKSRRATDSFIPPFFQVYGFTALHLAALDGLAQCVEMLIFYGADVTTKSKKGTTALNVITRKTPSSLAMITQKLDSAITLHQSQENATREVELELDFRQLLQHCHPREISYLNTFVDEGQKEFLEHPLCSAFLYIKWGKIRKYYIGRLVFCFITVLFLTLYVLTALAHTCYNGSKIMNETIKDQELCQKQSILGDLLRTNPFVIEMQWWVLVVIIIFEIFRKLYGLTGYTSVRRYVSQVENIIEWFVIVSVFLTSYIYNNRTDIWQNHIGKRGRASIFFSNSDRMKNITNILHSFC